MAKKQEQTITFVGEPNFERFFTVLGQVLSNKLGVELTLIGIREKTDEEKQKGTIINII